MESYTIIILIFVIISIFFIILLYFYNQLVIYKNKVKVQYESIYLHMEEIMALLDDFSLWLEGNYSMEKDLVKKIRKFCFQYREEKDMMTQLSYVKELKKLIRNVHQLEKVYPKILNDSEYLSFKDRYDSHYSEIMYAMDLFNKGVEEYNLYKKKRIVSLLSRLFRYPDYVSYQK